MLKEETLQHKLLNKGAWIYIFTILGAPLLYVTRVMLSNTVSVADFGVLYSLIGLILLSLTISSLGLAESMRYFLPKHYVEKQPDQARNLIRQNILIRIGMSALIVLITVIFAEQIAVSYLGGVQYTTILYPMLICLVGFGIIDTARAYFESLQEIKTNQALDFYRKLFVAIGIGLLLAVGVDTVLHYARAWAIGISGAALVSAVLLWQSDKSIFSGLRVYRDRVYNSKYFSFGLIATVGTSAIVLLNQIDQQMVLYFLGAEDAGYYSNYVSLMMLIAYLIGPLLGYLFPIISEINAKQQTQKLSLLIEYFYNYLLFFVALLGVFFTVYGEQVAAVLYGEQYMISGEMLSVVAPFIVINILFSLNFSIMMGMGDSKTRTRIIWYALVANIVLNAILIPMFGMRGAIIATVCAWAIMGVLSTNYVHTICPIIFHRRRRLFHLPLLVAFGVIGRVTYSALPWGGRLFNLFILAGIGAVMVIVLVGLNWKRLRGIVNKLH